MARFHALTVTDVRPETRDSVVVSLRPDKSDEDLFRFVQGQYLTFRKDFDGEEVRRCYSVCSGVAEGTLSVGIKKVPGGAFSTWANENLKIGDRVEAMPPLGHFHSHLDPGQAKTYAAFAAGSGITPILSIAKTILAVEPKSRFTLLYANRQVASIMFREELEDLKNRYLGRLQVIHVLKSDTQDAGLFSGRIDAQKLDRLFETIIDPASIDLAFLCGPQGLMETVRGSLKAHGVSDQNIKQELFKADQPGRLKKKPNEIAAIAAGKAIRLTVTLDGISREIDMQDGETVLEAARREKMDAPFSCCAGVCSTCRGRLLEGEVEMAANHALEDNEIRDGYILTCQSRPLTTSLSVTYDA